LVSSDTSTIPLCLKKLREVLEDGEWASVERAAALVLERTANGTGAGATHRTASQANRSGALKPELADGACRALLRALQGGRHASFVLLLLRALALHLPAPGGRRLEFSLRGVPGLDPARAGETLE
jgi:hypothetical protein